MLKRIIIGLVIGIFVVFGVIAAMLIINPKGGVKGNTEGENPIGGGTALTYTVHSKLVSNNTQGPIPTFQGEFTKGQQVNFRLYDVGYGYNERDGYRFSHFMLGNEKIQNFGDIFSRVFKSGFTITAYYVQGGALNGNMIYAGHLPVSSAKIGGGAGPFTASQVTGLENIQHGEKVTFRFGAGQPFNFSGFTFSHVTVNGTRVNASPNFQYVNGIPVLFNNNVFQFSMVRNTTLVFYYN